MRTTQLNPIELQRFLVGVDYPATKRELVEHARARHADEVTMAQLLRIPERRYESPIAVSRACAGHSR